MAPRPFDRNGVAAAPPRPRVDLVRGGGRRAGRVGRDELDGRVDLGRDRHHRVGPKNYSDIEHEQPAQKRRRDGERPDRLEPRGQEREAPREEVRDACARPGSEAERVGAEVRTHEHRCADRAGYVRRARLVVVAARAWHRRFDCLGEQERDSRGCKPRRQVPIAQGRVDVEFRDEVI